MKKFEIKNANACYTGGGIYIYYGQLENELYFRACDDWEVISICDADTSTEEADYQEFYEEHELANLIFKGYRDFWNAMLNKIIEDRPSGNYQPSELQRRLLK